MNDNYIPKDKFDVECVKRIELLPDNEYMEILPELIPWIADSNRPVSSPLAQVIFQRIDISEKEIIKVLSADNYDDGWKWSVLYFYRDYCIKKPGDEMMRALKRIKISPTPGEKQEGLTEVLEEIFDKIAKN